MYFIDQQDAEYDEESFHLTVKLLQFKPVGKKPVSLHTCGISALDGGFIRRTVNGQILTNPNVEVPSGTIGFSIPLPRRRYFTEQYSTEEVIAIGAENPTFTPLFPKDIGFNGFRITTSLAERHMSSNERTDLFKLFERPDFIKVQLGTFKSINQITEGYIQAISGTDRLSDERLAIAIEESLCDLFLNLFLDKGLFTPKRKALFGTVVRKSLSIIHSTPRYELRRLSTERLSEKLNTSSRTVQLSFKSVLGISVIKYINELLIHEAALLIRNGHTANKVESIANSLGFTHMGNFSGQFKKIYGQTPKQYQLDPIIDDPIEKLSFITERKVKERMKY